MDYKELVDKLRNNNAENDCHDCALGYYAFEAATAITDLLAHVEAAEARCKRLDEARERANEACAKWEHRAEKAERNAKDIRARWIIRKEDYGVSPLIGDRVEHVKYTCSNCGYETGTQAEKFVCCPICTARMDGGKHETD